MNERDGGYDNGYKACPCFWGIEPAGFILTWLIKSDFELAGKMVLNVGCGEGKNAIYCSRRGATVFAVDVSEAALENARKTWPDYSRVTWKVADL